MLAAMTPLAEQELIESKLFVILHVSFTRSLICLCKFIMNLEMDEF